MKKCILWFLIVFFQISFSQENRGWKGYFSYNQITAISETNNKIYAAAGNALFYKKLDTNEIKTINTIDGLSGQTISSIYHSSTFNKTMVGYENGLMIIVNDSDGSIFKVVDIINKNIPSNIKKINSFTEYNGVVYISCDFGIVEYKLAALEFGDTFFIGVNGKEEAVYQTAILNGTIYAITQTTGMRRASVTNPNLNDYSQWEFFDSSTWSGIVTFNNQIIATKANNKVYRLANGQNFIELVDLGQPNVDIRTTPDYLIITTIGNVLIYNQSLSNIISIFNWQMSSEFISFSCATVINNTILVGTNETGVVSSKISSPIDFEFILPQGPSKNNVFSIDCSSSNLWAVYGGYSPDYNPYSYSQGALAQFGISKYSENSWKHIPYSDVLGARALSKIVVNPNNEKQVYATSFFSGLLELDNDVPTTLFNQTNSSLESLQLNPPDPSYVDIRINATAFDKSGNLWMTNGRVKNGLKELKSNGQWQSYSMEYILDKYSSSNYSKIAIDKNGTKWIATYLDGVIAFNEKNNVFKKLTEGSDLGNLPSRDVRAIAVDNRNQVWIGTIRGLRVISNAGSYFGADQIKANAVIILEEGVAQELLYEQFITDIAVNGSNQKWIGTADSGVFLFSSDGQQTIYHFTKDNSPLPSNNINDIDINPVTGEVFFATDKGMVSFQGASTTAAENLNDVYVFPNPVRPEYLGTVKIAGLISKANIKITDIEGNLVFETTSDGGMVEWDTTAFGKYKVASGVYMIFVAAQDASETTVKKVMIIR